MPFVLLQCLSNTNQSLVHKKRRKISNRRLSSTEKLENIILFSDNLLINVIVAKRIESWWNANLK